MCLSPITIKNPSKGFWRSSFGSVQVPCGKCLECLSVKQNGWMQRLVYEFGNWSDVLFVTLTYNEDKCPLSVNLDTGESFRTVVPRHCQDAIKRFRTLFAKRYPGRKFKYFLTSEYGPRTLRPHYHALFFGLSLSDFVLFKNDWQKRFGYVCVKRVKVNPSDRVKVARYVSKYCSKGFFENPYVADHKVEKTFHLCSHGIGDVYIRLTKNYHLCKDVKIPKFRNGRYNPEWLSAVHDRCGVNLPGDTYRYGMCTYYRRKIYGSGNALSVAMSDFLFKSRIDDDAQQLESLLSSHPDWTYVEAFNFLNMQDVQAKKLRAKSLRERFGRFYDRSKL